MTELTDELVDKLETWLDKRNVELSTEGLDELRETLDNILEKYEE